MGAVHSDRPQGLRLQVEIQADVARAVTAEAPDLESLLVPATLAISTRLGAGAVGIWTAEAGPGELRLQAVTAAEGAPVARRRAGIGESYAVALATAARPSVFIDPPFEQPLFAAELDGRRTPTAVCPLVLDGRRLVGVLALVRADPLDAAEEQAFASVADQIALAIEKGRALLRLREREDGLDILIGTAPDGIVVMDARSRILATNQSLDRSFGYERGELVGQEVTVLMPERFRQRHAGGVRRYLETGEKRIPWTGVELVGLRKDGTELPIEISFGEYVHEGAKVFTGFIRDISDRKRVEEQERRRRRVIQTAAVYVGSSLIALQAADLLLPVLPLPDWTFRGMVLVGFLCFPVALALAWTFELSPEGLRRAAKERRAAGGTAAAGRVRSRLGWTGAAGLLAGLTLAAMLILAAPERPAVFGSTGAAALAVLPFEDVSDRETRADLGLTDEILARLTRHESLRVTSRTSTLALAGSPARLPELARALQVDYVLEGSVRRTPDRMRVTAQLIAAASDRHVWSASYDGDVSDPLAAEAEVAERIAAAVAARIGEETGTEGEREAHDDSVRALPAR